MRNIYERLIIVRGGGDIATGTIYKLVKSGFHVLILEIAHPSAIRRNVAFSEAVYEEKWRVEDMTCHLAHDIKEAEQIMKAGNPALMIDPNGEMIKQLHPIAVVDAILAKKNLGTTRDMAPITIALGPGFTAGDKPVTPASYSRTEPSGKVIFIIIIRIVRFQSCKNSYFFMRQWHNPSKKVAVF